MAAKSGEFVVVPVTAHPQDSASEPKPVTEGRAAAGAGVLARDHRAPFADRDARPLLTMADTNADDVFARERGVSSREAAWLGASESDHLVRETGEPLLLDKHRAAGMGVFARERGMSFGEALLGKNLPAVLREVDAPLLDKKLFGEDEDHFFAFKNGAPPFTGLVAADEHGVRTDKGERVAMITAAEALRAAPSAPHAEQVAIDVLVGVKEVPVAAGGGNLSTVVGIFAASTAVTMVAAGAVSPPVAFATFLLLLGGLFVSVSGVLEN
uniref:Uncharacterized protein n=1 Tax=Oryza punctata TaxID=4537 RepID=A0A0E0LRZ0_ORYPU